MYLVEILLIARKKNLLSNLVAKYLIRKIKIAVITIARVMFFSIKLDILNNQPTIRLAVEYIFTSTRYTY